MIRDNFLYPPHEMAEGHKEFTLSVCLFIYKNHVQPITLSSMVEFKNNFAQMIIMTRLCVTNKNHVARSKVKVTVST